MENSLQGHIQKRKVRCGKTNCKCVSGELHTAFYRVWIRHGRRFQQYIRKDEIEAVQTACESYRRERRETRAARIQLRQIIALYRQLSDEKYGL